MDNQIAICISDPQQIPNKSNPPALLRSTSQFPLLVDHEQRLAIEQFGVLRSRLLVARKNQEFRSVVITSPQKQDGKSFTSANLAICLAQLRQLRILVVDGDLRRSGLTKALGLGDRLGLADYLRNSASFEECVTSTELTYLFVCPSGQTEEESLPAILEGKAWPELVEKAKQKFDLLIVDSVPVSAPIADLELVLNCCDVALLVVRVRKTAREALHFATDRLRGKMMGVIVNSTEFKADFDYHSSYVQKGT